MAPVTTTRAHRSREPISRRYTIRFFHGTSAQNLNDILQRGIQPRGEAVGNWPDLPSAPDHVYLTTAYPLWYAYSSIDATAYAMDMALLLEVETDGLGEGKFYPMRISCASTHIFAR